MSRIGLVQLTSSARNSPFGVEKAAFDKSANNKVKTHPEPLKLKKYQQVAPSPLAVTPVSSPFDVFCEESKENVETQTLFENHSISTQTSISVPHTQPAITESDLTADTPTVNYYRVMADRLQMDYDDEIERNGRLVAELGDLDEQTTKIDEDMEILLEVLADIDEEQMGDELGTAHV
ncbi:CRE-GMN-1 protein [Caenorhabditis remanei]|uniref:CRE-GMN-1 protein n=1 Tax=Caenorhabditis remanei TaxID=31234 RepID=E3MFR9_CAERE|nr:CRE-GMN-1 protein [Caenorhabditis remanei]